MADRYLVERLVDGESPTDAVEGLAGLSDKPRPGPPPKYGLETDKRVMAT